ncbi:MAG: DPP IV N-terminal domain-containing protein [Bacteroidia bacterium]|nr:DPP IV N-terminal domain-containing protein [Bacteroidia bacterium]
MKKYLLLILLFTHNIYAQDKLFTMTDAVLNARTSLAPQTLKQLKWIKNSAEYSYVGTDNNLYKATAFTGKAQILVSLNDLNKALKNKNEDTLSSFPGMEWEDMNSFIFKANKKRWMWITSVKTLELRELDNFPNDAENIEKDKKKGFIAYTQNDNLHIWNAGKIYHITTDGSSNIVYGQSVHRNEFGINKGIFWGNTGDYLAFYRMDQSMVKDYPITDYNEKPAKANLIKYPMSGDSSHHVTLGIFNLKTLKTIYIKTPPPADHYLTNIAFSTDDKWIYIAELNRDQNSMQLNCYNTTTGNFEKTLFTETDNNYVEPLNPILWVTGKSGQFVWQSRRDGWNHLYLYDASGKLLKQLSKGDWEVTQVLGFSDNGEKVFFEATKESPLNRDLYYITLADNKIVRLTNGNGVNRSVMNSGGNYFINYFSNPTTPNNIQVIDSKTKKILDIFQSSNPLTAFKLGEMNLFSITNKQGDKLFCRTYKPIDFDSTKKYPVIVYLYGGPHAQMVKNSWLGGGNLWFQYMAQKGYLVFTLDNRGSEASGKKFEQATFRQLGTIEMEDQLEGVNYLKSLKYVDASRMGVHGWSFGGFLTTSLMTRNPEVFKVAVAGGPVIDWSYYEIMYTERYMDTPQSNPEGYKNSNLLNYVDKLKGKLMLIHGTSDDVVLWQHSLLFTEKAVEKNIQLDYFPYPGHLHNVTGKDRVHLMQKISNYFFDYL